MSCATAQGEDKQWVKDYANLLQAAQEDLAAAEDKLVSTRSKTWNFAMQCTCVICGKPVSTTLCNRHRGCTDFDAVLMFAYGVDAMLKNNPSLTPEQLKGSQLYETIRSTQFIGLQVTKGSLCWI